MVSGGTVAADASTLNGYLSNYSSEISGLGTWKGPSHDSITSKAEAFVSEYKAVVSQMTSFANACSEYENYIKIKNLISKTETDRANASDENKASYDSPLAEMRSNLDKSKSKIQSYLNEASSPSLTATSVADSISGITTLSKSSSGSSNNQAIIDSVINDVGNTISDYSGLGFNDGEWCSDFVSYALQKSGYDVEWSSIAGHEDDNTIFQVLSRAGATIHRDQAAQYNGEDYDPDYSPQAGDVVLFDFARGGTPDGTTDHVGLVIQDNGDGTVKTIEGNTSGEGGGSCVAIHDRDRSMIYGYATPVKN